MEEIWKPIPGFPDYKVSNMGQVKSYKNPDTPRLLKATLTRCSHLILTLQASDRSRTKGIHQLVMLAFVGPCPEGMEVCHNDGNPQNNQLSNLRYDTRAGNCRDAMEHRRLLREIIAKENARLYSGK